MCILGCEVFSATNGPNDSCAGLASGRGDADSGAGCPRTPARRSRTAARARMICRGRNRLLLSPCRWFRPQRPPLPGRGTPPVGDLESRPFWNLLPCSAKAKGPLAELQLAKNEKFEESIADEKSTQYSSACICGEKLREQDQRFLI